MLLDRKPAYDGAISRDWYWGINDIDNTNSANYVGPAGTTSYWLGGIVPFQGLTAGTHSITKFKLQHSFCLAADLDATWLVILKRDSAAAGAGTWTEVSATNVLSLLTISASIIAEEITLGTPVQFTNSAADVAAGYYYAAMILLHGPAGRTAAHPGLRRLTAGNGPRGWWWQVAGDARPTTFTEASADAGFITLPYLRFTVQSTLRRPFSLATPHAISAGKILVPRLAATAGNNLYHVLRDTITPATETLTVTGRRWVASGASVATLLTAITDMGVTDQMTFGGSNAALINGSEAGQKIDQAILVRPLAASTRGNLFYLDKQYATGPTAPGLAEDDIATIAHGAKASGVRGTDYALDAAAPRHADWIEIARSGTATMASLAVSVRVGMGFGDSQIGVKSDGLAQLNRLGSAFFDALADPIPWWTAGVPGNRLRESSAGNHTAGYLRYRSTTPGQGDICDMYSLLFLFALGVNDVSAGGILDDDDALNIARGLSDRLMYILADLFELDNAKDNQAILVGLPPWTVGNALQDQCIRYFNQMMIGAALGACLADYQPYDLVYANAATYLESGLHYSTTGAAAVAAQAAANYEASRIHTPGFGSSWF